MNCLDRPRGAMPNGCQHLCQPLCCVVNLVIHFVLRLGCGGSAYASPYANGTTMARTHRSVRVDPDLLAELDELARQQLVPAGFTDQVDVALRLLVRHAAEQQTRHAAGLVGADRSRAEKTYRQLRRRRDR